MFRPNIYEVWITENSTSFFILTDYKHGFTQRELSAKYHKSLRDISKILKEHSADASVHAENLAKRLVTKPAKMVITDVPSQGPGQNAPDIVAEVTLTTKELAIIISRLGKFKKTQQILEDALKRQAVIRII